MPSLSNVNKSIIMTKIKVVSQFKDIIYVPEFKVKSDTNLYIIGEFNEWIPKDKDIVSSL